MPEPNEPTGTKEPAKAFLAEGNTAAEVLMSLLAQGATITDLAVGITHCVIRHQKIEVVKPGEDSRAKGPYFNWMLDDGASDGPKMFAGAGLTEEQARLLLVTTETNGVPTAGVPFVLSLQITGRQISPLKTIAAKYIERHAASAARQGIKAASVDDDAMLAEINRRLLLKDPNAKPFESLEDVYRRGGK
jgi:hypothetical protein